MPTTNIKQEIILLCTPKQAYDAWFDSKTHGEMIGAKAVIDPKVGGLFDIWERDITGKTLKLNPDKFRIVQEWRYNYEEWPKDQRSKITIEFLPYKKDQTKLKFLHTGFPAQYTEEFRTDWKKYYWDRMKKYFTKRYS